ncbi:aldolase [Schizophyllum commune H4-8]|uniref:aldolase n=1 Tax=Schizophyllum commune (strain H4-8 / FGSC 9210) TaxID=578458 RepID=UPI00215F0BAA|nr:aldolase [Schizophyllum commune H4-8]KAI5891304.1 aldolase [Schizophyllum commune H4-8]
MDPEGLSTEYFVRPRRGYATARDIVRIVEVGPRDGLQNEKGTIPADVKVQLIDRLGRAGMRIIESGSFVSPKWVPQMASSAEVLNYIERLPGVRYPVLIPNQKGLETLVQLMAKNEQQDMLITDVKDDSPHPVPTDEIAVFTAATDAFNKANTNATVAESLDRLAPVIRHALDLGLRVRGYVSVVIACPYSGRVDARQVRDVAKALVDMGCYEISLGDTVGQGTPWQVTSMIEEVSKDVNVDKLAGHFHDTFGMAIANVFAALSAGVRTIDSSIGGLGGCPYSPGATGNVATEDVVYALKSSPYSIDGNPDLDALVDIGYWISAQLGRENASRVGNAIRSRRLRDNMKKERAKL